MALALCFLSSDRQSSCYICLAFTEKKSPPADWQRQAGENLHWSSFGRRFLSSSLTPWQPALVCLLPLNTVLLQLQGQCLMTAGLRDENLYISVTTSQDADGSLGRREKARTCLVRQERDGDAAKTSPKLPSSLGCRQQSPALLRAASWTSVLKNAKSGRPRWHGPSLIQFNKVQQPAAPASNKKPTTGREGGVERGQTQYWGGGEKKRLFWWAEQWQPA